MKLKSLILTAIVLFVCSAVVPAQDDIHKVEAAIGYVNNRLDNGLTSNDPDIHDFFSGRTSTNGIMGSVKGNVSKYVGIKGEVTYYTKDDTGAIGGSPFEIRYHGTTVMGGIEIKNNLKEGPRFKPFAHVLAGLAHQNITSDDIDDTDLSSNSFTMAFGAGLDIRVHHNVDIRLIQVDYNPVFRNKDVFVVDPSTVPPTTVSFSRQDNIRFGFGIVFH